MKRFLVSLAMIPLLAGPALAGCGPRRSVCNTVAVVEEVVAPVLVATFVPIPLYSAAYVQPTYVQASPAVVAQSSVQAAPAASPCEQQLAALNARIAALESGQRQQPAPSQIPAPQAIHPGKAVFQQRCAGCHDAAKLKDKQPAFQRDGALVSLDCGTLLDGIADVAVGSMPKGQQLTEQEARDLIEWMRQASKKPAGQPMAPAK